MIRKPTDTIAETLSETHIEANKYSLVKRLVAFFITSFGVLALIAKAFGLLIHPSLHMDEAYYIGAAKAILHGDILLTTYGFDKLFLLPFLLTPGLLFAGENPIGFRIVGLFFTIASVFVFRRVLKLGLERTWPEKIETSSFTFSLMTVLAFGLFLQPLALAHGISAMAEPSLLFFLLLGAKHVLDPQTENTLWPRSWALASMVKLSSVMWLPLFIGSQFIREFGQANPTLPELREKAIRFALTFWRQTKWLWIFAFFFMAMNRQKFAALGWFSHLSKSNPQASDFGARLMFWFHSIQSATWNSGLLIFVIIVVSFAISIRSLKLASTLRSERIFLRWRVVILGALLLHAVGLPLSGAPLFERYLVVFMPQFVLAAIVACVHIFGLVSLSAPQFALKLSLALGGALVLIGASQSPLPLEPGVEQGRTLEAMRDLLPRSAVLVSPHLWETRPYEARTWTRDTCMDLECLWRGRQGSQSDNQYLFRKVDQRFVLERAPLVVDRRNRLQCYKTETTTFTIPLKRSIQASFAERIRLKDASTQISMKTSAREVTTSPIAGDIAGDTATAGSGGTPTTSTAEQKPQLIEIDRVDLLDGVPVQIQVSVKNIEAELTGRLILIDPFDPQNRPGDFGIGLWVEGVTSTRIPGYAAADLLAIIWKGRVLKLSRLDLQAEQNQLSTWRLLDVTSDGTAALIQKDTAKLSSGCAGQEP